MSADWLYRTRSWKIARVAVLLRDDHRCKVQLPGCKGRANSADHIVELEEGGAPLALSNLQAACMSCNVAKRNLRKSRERRGLSRGSVRSW
jgi:5-methylcytosine-specific restriction protein A